MGWFQKNVIDPVRQAPKKIVVETKRAVDKVENNVVEPVLQAPSKTTREIGRGVESVGNYPTKILNKGGEYLGSVAGSVGSATGDLVQGLTPALQGLVPIAKDVLGALNGGEYLNRKAEFDSVPKLTTGSISQPFNFQKLVLPAIIFLIIGLVFYFIRKRK